MTPIDAAIERGEFDLAAELAADIPGPALYRDTMVRIFEAKKRRLKTMMSWTKQTMRLTSLNVRRELAGKDPADGRTASDLGLLVKGGNDILDKLSPHLRGSFYTADVDKQGVLLPHALTKLIHPLLKTEGLLFDLKLSGYKVLLQYGVTGDRDVELEDCLVNNFRLTFSEGGTVEIAMRVQFHPQEGELELLAESLKQDVTVTMTPPADGQANKVAKALDLADQASAQTADAI